MQIECWTTNIAGLYFFFVDDLYCVKNISYSIHLVFIFIVIFIIIVIHSRESEYRTININSIVIVIVIPIINVFDAGSGKVLWQ